MLSQIIRVGLVNIHFPRPGTPRITYKLRLKMNIKDEKMYVKEPKLKCLITSNVLHVRKCTGVGALRPFVVSSVKLASRPIHTPFAVFSQRNYDGILSGLLYNKRACQATLFLHLYPMQESN